MIKGEHINKLITTYLPAFEGRITPLFTTRIDVDSIVYFIKAIDNEPVSQIQLEIRLICADYDDSELFSKQITDIFTTNENKKAVTVDEISFRAGLGGGGTLFRDDLQMYENTMFFNLKVKTKEEKTNE
ncbi:hypothetical protein AOA01_00315 [Listeria monocytogenes]|uniref:hypothetical protein n=1 Tax=Listeria monocytogenes TaxID=1639 RepID=UPI000775FA5B|nr:hypothetical protein [Listeria monocytogenes]EAF5877622.1 hypothetical protein [Listeria monocytogenes]EKZ4877800.1 hypothetical protein [Listeria monocytogenes]KXS65752.1 hypothetical protein AWJ02_01475 [Listeria monocytogenes]KXW92907.1 hypothetical protein AWJ00_08230 [Listeria monocytogenes]